MLEATWNYLTTHFSESQLWVATAILHTVLFAGLNGLLYLIDRWSLFEKYRIQPGIAPASPLVREAFWEMIKKHVIIGPVSFVLLIPLARWTQIIDKTDPIKTPNSVLPSFSEVALHLLFFIVLQDTIFYWSHRALHHPYLYKRIHKRHHKFHSNIGIASEYAHPIEDVLNTIAMMAGPFYIGTHLFTLWIWFIIRIWETIDAHSGFAFPFPLSPFALWSVAERHDYHHSQNRGCYGSFFGMWDRLMGTDQMFNNWKKATKEKENAKKRNQVKHAKKEAEQMKVE